MMSIACLLLHRLFSDLCPIRRAQKVQVARALSKDEAGDSWVWRNKMMPFFVSVAHGPATASLLALSHYISSCQNAVQVIAAAAFLSLARWTCFWVHRSCKFAAPAHLRSKLGHFAISCSL